MSSLYFCVFSYNRGQFLQNCIDSIEKCSIESTIIIFDDNSNDPETIAILKKLGQKYSIVQPQDNSLLEGKFGGLYNNMQLALNQLPDNQLFCFIQDDMQCCRVLDDDDILDIQHFFNRNQKAAFLHPAFMKGVNRKKNQNSTVWHSEHQVYYRENVKQSAGLHFSAIIISRKDILQKAGWQFSNREKLNDMNARRQFGKMGFMKNPFCLWLPQVPIYRGKRKTLAIKIAEIFRRPKLYPVKILSATESAKFKARETGLLPFSEDFLSLTKGQLKPPWFYGQFEQQRFLKILNRIELHLLKFFK